MVSSPEGPTTGLELELWPLQEGGLDLGFSQVDTDLIVLTYEIPSKNNPWALWSFLVHKHNDIWAGGYDRNPWEEGMTVVCLTPFQTLSYVYPL